MANYQKINTSISDLEAASKVSILGVNKPLGTINVGSSKTIQETVVNSAINEQTSTKYQTIGGNFNLGRNPRNQQPRIPIAKSDRNLSKPSGYNQNGSPTYGSGRANTFTTWSVDNFGSGMNIAIGNGQRPQRQNISIVQVGPTPPNVTVGPDVTIAYATTLGGGTPKGVLVGFSTDASDFTGNLSLIDITDSVGTISPTSYSIVSGLIRFITSREIGDFFSTITFNQGNTGFVFTNSGVLIAPFVSSVGPP